MQDNPDSKNKGFVSKNNKAKTDEERNPSPPEGVCLECGGDLALPPEVTKLIINRKDK